MFYGYARVSTAGQDLSGQVERLKAAGCDTIFLEKVSGAKSDRPELRRALKALASGDTLMVVAVDRLARDTRDLLNILHEVKEAGAGFRSLNEPIVDTTSDLADVVLAVLGIAAKWERTQLKERTSAGRALAVARGVKLGRKLKLNTEQRREILARVAAGEPQRRLAELYGVGVATISRLIKSAEKGGNGNL
ncbi:recombinase family protein [Agrobacterium tumefaciens]|uniref:recombinase family protein n=1 Tax=Agrobacterium tumefaciens TaxID=358 RepID=UPI0022084172|nr:recombinase family protein [Agrobacterium tumefaciens]